MLKITNLPKNSISYKAGLRVGDIVVAFNNTPAADMLDVAYFDSQEAFSCTVNRGEASITFHIAKDANSEMGWDFDDDSYISPKWCANKCIFCFVDQLPKNLRKTLYVKDDDWRLSFVSGNYVTLSSITEKEIARICERKFSPIYVSVHATDDVVRRRLLGNDKALAIMPLLQRLADSGITIHTQVVMVAGYNDGEVLNQTMADLATLYPQVNSLAVVPVGLTKHRQCLCDLPPISRDIAAKTITDVENFDKQMFEFNGQHFVYCSDEMYIYAGLPLPPYEYYGDFAQLENGVGLVADLRYQFNLAYCNAVAAKKQSYTIVTGVSAAPFLEELLTPLRRDFPDAKINIAAVENQFFGSTVTVAGLLVGADIAAALAERHDINDILLLPRVMLRENEDVFLDGMTLAELSRLTNKKIIVLSDGFELAETILECI
jgi:putative radical SAM enzyme (TIGR03279 family)